MNLVEKWRQADMKNKITNAVCLLTILIMVPFCIHWTWYRFTHAITDDAFVESDLIDVTPRVAGHIGETLVDDSSPIKKGQVLALLDPVDYQAQVDLGQAKLEKAHKSYETLDVTLERARLVVEQDITISENGLVQASENLKKAQSELVRVEKDFTRIDNLYKNSSVPKHRFDLMRTEQDSAQATLNASRAQVKIAEENQKKALTGRIQIKELETRLAMQAKEIREAEKALEVARLNLEHTRITSPINGVVAKKFIYAGDYVTPGHPIFSIYDTDNVFVRAHLEETKMKGVKLGQKVDFDVDAFSHKFHGRVIQIGDASGAQFMLIPRDTTTGEFTKVVQRIPIKMKIEDDSDHQLKPGYSVEIGIARD